MVQAERNRISRLPTSGHSLLGMPRQLADQMEKSWDPGIMPHSKRGSAQLCSLLFQRLDAFSCLPMIVLVFGGSESPPTPMVQGFRKCLLYASIIRSIHCASMVVAMVRDI